MDTLLLPGQNPRAWAETMINLEARKLVNTANTVAAMHLQDGFIRIQFVDEIRAFIMAQFEAARRAKTDDDCMACLRALRAENTSLLEQSRSLRTGYAKLYAEVKVVRDENKIVGYIISAVDVVVAGAAIFGGIVMMSSMTPVGVVAGAVIVVNGLNTISGVVCGRGRNPTLRLWPTIFSGKIDVFPGDRRSRLISSMTSVAPA
ncbi:TPA: DUF4225 domain-containing protein [Enterobacter hormaechei]|nr:MULTISPECIES: DUF4225 domain-containing protein [Enterobacter cloacae complex]MBK2963635.1 DUF4225 domain-containing protein [Klebsiella pneumoniae]HAS0824941.1 DUF4225 domain-containing protein [Enterobacter cloacae subsp. cloacae]MCJ5910873.1 DUF4225 domain-containing protein [Klebsiella pneumoniae]MCJ6915146.1 DUF4225 domain-containing protein [Klebsiella pneumoniae]MCJ6938117.1 DUF4225 domain-containing protein [Klebsiella pneumoniae]